MKTVKQMLKEIKASKELEQELISLESIEEIEVFLKEHCCAEPVEKFITCAKLDARSKGKGELSDEELADVVGGGQWTGLEWSGGWFFGHTTPFGFWLSDQYLEIDSMASGIQRSMDAGDMAEAKRLYDNCLSYMSKNGRCDSVYVNQVKNCWPELASYTGPVGRGPVGDILTL